MDQPALSLYEYIKVMEGALLGSGIRLWIYDSPCFTQIRDAKALN